jgi:hypothetical protein
VTGRFNLHRPIIVYGRSRKEVRFQAGPPAGQRGAPVAKERKPLPPSIAFTLTSMLLFSTQPWIQQNNVGRKVEEEVGHRRRCGGRLFWP